MIKDHINVVDEYLTLDVWKDGRLSQDACVSVWDHAFLYGDGCFEGMRVFAGALFKAPEHLARLRRSARALQIDLEWSDDKLVDAIADVVRVNALTDAHVRIILTRGAGAPGLDPRRSPRPSVVVMAYPFPPLLGDSPLRMIVGAIARKSPRSVDARIKSLNYLDAVLAKLQANAAGADDAFMLDGNGLVAEATTANVFVVHDGVVSTPTTRSALPGITRATVIDLLRLDGVEVLEREVTWGDLYTADECFLTGTGVGIVSVASIDGRILPHPRGDATARARELYRSATRQPEHLTPLGSAR